MQQYPQFRAADSSMLPISALGAAEFVTWLAVTRRVKVSTIKGYLTHIRSLHRESSASIEGLDNPIVERVYHGIKPTHGKPDHRPKLPITIDILHRLVDSLDVSTCGEFTVGKAPYFNSQFCLTRDCVSVFTSPPHWGQVHAPSPLFKIIFATLLPLLPIHCFQDETRSPLTRMHFITALNTQLTLIAIDASLYSGHSFRCGAATTTSAAGACGVEVKGLDHWKSDTYMLCIDIALPRGTLEVSQRLYFWVAPLDAAPVPPDLHAPWLA
ncbi:hypothetical protein AURDEDRAFT_165080 [Auricularia subglabra TFB-10046 SS5]|nr:hypothetical protein AURDEDRAFT_165080 [Auricularia subglabra TFB-10046 SS5]